MDRRKRVSPTQMLLKILWGVFTAVVVVLFFADRFLMDNWADLSADELVYHLKSTLEGTNPEMIRDAVLYYALPAAVLLGVLFAVLYFLRKKAKYRTAFMAGCLAVEIALLLFVKNELDRKIGLTDYIKWALSDENVDFIADNYVNPGKVKLTFPEKKRNLVYIFLESAEMTYADQENGGAFEQNVIPELTQMGLENEDFSGEEPVLNGGISLPGSNWTAGAMFAMATGAPLKVPINGNNIRSEEDFFPKMKSLGTILQEQGYRQELLIGSNASFGGRDYFYKGHGDFDIRDYKYARENGRIPEDYKEFWGYEDEKLYQFAREDLQELAKDGRPFNLTILTADTHFEDGYRCRLCKDEFGEQYADAFACCSRQVTEFVHWIQQQDFYENTTIVVCGDHPTMDKDFCKDVPEEYQRKTFVAIINGKIPDQDTWKGSFREYSTMDLFPTTLAAMDVRIAGNRLGMGTNLYSQEETLIEKYGLEECNSGMLLPSPFLDHMTGIRIDEEVLEQASKVSYVRLKDYGDGTVRISLHGVGNAIDFNYVDKVELEITDKTNGETETYELEQVQRKNNVALYYYPLEYDLKGKSLEDLDAVFYISAGGIEHYRVADLEHDLVD